jgi:hypothetical protein
LCENEKPESLKLSVNLDAAFISSELGVPATVFETKRIRASPEVNPLTGVIEPSFSIISCVLQEKAQLHRKTGALQTKLQGIRRFQFTVVASSPVRVYCPFPVLLTV